MVGQVLVVAVQNDVDRRHLGTAMATTTFFRGLGGAIGAAVLYAVFAVRSVGTPEGGDTGVLLTALGMAGHRTGQLPPPLASAALASAVPNLLAPIYLGDGRRRCGGSPPAGRFPGLIITATAGRYVGRVR